MATPAKAAPKAAPAAKPKAKTPSVMVSIKGADGNVKRVAMAKPKAIALAKKRAAARGAAKTSASLADTTAMIPGAYKSYVDPGSIDAAVSATIKSQNDPLLAMKAAAQAQATANQQASNSLTGQTQATMDTLLANANDRTTAFQQLSGQAIAQQQASNRDAAAALQHALGGGYNSQVEALTAAGMAPTYANDSANGVANTFAGSLASQAQADYYNRGKALASMTGQAFNLQQQRQLGQVLGNLDAQIAANQSKKAQLVADTAAQQAQFGLQANTAAQAFGQQQIENAQKDRSLDIDAAKVTASTKNAAASAAAKLSTAQAKVLAAVKKDVDKKAKDARSGTRTVTVRTLDANGNPMNDKNGKPLYHTETQAVTAADVFGKGNGPWREAWTQLTDQWGALGMSPQQAADMAALQATKWYPDSIKRSSVANITAMLKNRGVSAAVIKQIAGMVPAGNTGTASGNSAAAQAKKLRAEALSWIKKTQGPDKGLINFNGQLWKLTPKLGTWKGQLAYIFEGQSVPSKMFVPAVAGKSPIVIANGKTDRLVV